MRVTGPVTQMPNYYHHPPLGGGSKGVAGTVLCTSTTLANEPA